MMKKKISIKRWAIWTQFHKIFERVRTVKTYLSSHHSLETFVFKLGLKDSDIDKLV